MFVHWRERAWKWLVLPGGLYLLGLVIFAWPWFAHFGSAVIGNSGDPLQNIWNLWWFQHAIDTHHSIYFTDYLHWPSGSTLLGHTLSPWNDLVALPATWVFGRIVAYNLLVAGSFVLTGVATFWLAHHISKEYWGSLLAGAVVTFSTYHFVHADSHYALAAIQIIPMTLLAWLLFLERPRAWLGLITGLFTALSVYTDLYYGLYAVLGLALVTGVAWISGRVNWREDRRRLATGSIIAGAGFAACLPLVLALLTHQGSDPFVELRDPSRYSLDLVSWIVPSYNSHFASATRGLWPKFGHEAREIDVHLGFALTILTGLAAWAGWRVKAVRREVAAWLGFTAVFLLLALGPVLHAAGRVVTIWHYHGHEVFLPYNWLAKAVPGLSNSGVAVRVFVMSLIGFAIVLAIGVPLIWRKGRWAKGLIIGLLLLSCFELRPVTTHAVRLPDPGWVTMLRSQPGDHNSGVLDLADDKFYSLYYQTRYERPQAFGYLSRTPRSVDRRDSEIAGVLRTGDWQRLCRQYFFRYVVYPEVTNSPQPGYSRPAAKTLYSDRQVTLYDLESGYGPGCRRT